MSKPKDVIKQIKKNTRRKFSADDKIRIVLEGLRGEMSISELCRKEVIAGGNNEYSKLIGIINVVCKSNLHQWGLIWNLYVDDNDGKFSSGIFRSGGDTWVRGQ